ncbi:MAG: acetyl-CoA carboxylase carboxyltransferase subunit alpha [Rhodospirillales bacterium]|nr:acetyl-CoA carboxylase carboxyltransferase subunit alpha [Rhodospirillales bacterium]MCB9964974.1 acetyl-CoA carboxylase carboxyltransferase subunit alpha [Rhodospirillales bacterium]MCB9980437.1 acetyl-CoA carboxylase carboxyltransferase subunit alpha [Rhodospirillales bacterium]
MALDFEKPVLELEQKIAELTKVEKSKDLNMDTEIEQMRQKANALLEQLYTKLTPQQKIQVARHPERPHCKNYIKALIEDFTPLAGDRLFSQDEAMVSGIGRFEGQSCIILGQEKGSDTESRLKHNFGMARPEGYRKAQRLISMANQFHLPILTFVDTSGAYPGVGAEERGQSEAIAKSIEACVRARVPIISTIIGEGGSGGAIAIATADRVLMLQHAIYSVISPEGCASILWRSGDFAEEAARALKITARDLLRLGIIDEMVEEPIGGAHRNPAATFEAVRSAIAKNLKELQIKPEETLKAERREKYLAMTR